MVFGFFKNCEHTFSSILRARGKVGRIFKYEAEPPRSEEYLEIAGQPYRLRPVFLLSFFLLLPIGAKRDRGDRFFNYAMVLLGAAPRDWPARIHRDGEPDGRDRGTAQKGRAFLPEGDPVPRARAPVYSFRYMCHSTKSDDGQEVTKLIWGVCVSLL